MYCIDLNIDLPLFNTNLPVIEFLKSQTAWADNVNIRPHLARHFKLETENLTTELQLFFIKHNLHIELVEIFYMYPNNIMGIHSDRHIPGDYSKLNWAFGGADSIMNWYKVKTGEMHKTNNTPINSPSLVYVPNQVDLIHSQSVGQPSLVQVGCPHNVITKEQERFCVSIVFKHKLTRDRINMSDALDIFRDYIKL